MKNSKALSRSFVAGLLILGAQGAHAEDWKDASGLLSAFGVDPNEKSFLKDNNLKVGGWAEASVSANANATSNGYNGPITFQDKDGQFQMNQLNVYLQKAINVSGDSFDWGGRVDVMYGSDAIFTQAYGNLAGTPRGDWDLHLIGDQTYNMAIPNAYAEFNLPVGNGLDVKVGHFYTPIGYETVTAPDNFFFTKPYTFQYGEPFTHTGFLGNYAVDENWSAMAGAVTGSATGGWDGNFNSQLGNWSFLGGGTWTSDDKAYSLNVAGTAGNRSYSNPGNNSFWGMYSIVGKANWLDDDLHYVIQHDHGFANSVVNENLQDVNAQWYGINQYLMYDIEDNLGVGLRAEWFRDANGYRVQGPARCGASTNADPNNPSGASSFACPSFNNGATSAGLNNPYVASTNQWNNLGGGANYYQLTAGLNYKPLKWVILRPNARYDMSQGVNAFMQSNGNMVNYQFTFSFDATIVF